MPDRHDYVALEWVKGEIAETLGHARQSLDVFVASPHHSAALHECLNGVHQVHGSLQIIEFYGAALLAEEIEQLVLAVREQRVASEPEAVQLLNQAMTQLPIYLDRIHSARRDLPLVILPLLNDLRSARGESLLSETSLFAPQFDDIEPLDAATLALRDSPQLADLLRTWRQDLQASLLGLMREQDVPTQLEHMGVVFGRLQQLCQDAPLGALWRIVAALVQAMAAGSFTNSPALRSLFKEAGRELKRLTEQGVQGINQPAPQELLKSLLFYIAKSNSQAPAMVALKDEYALDEALPDSHVVDEERARMAGPDRDAMRSVILAVCEGLVRAKERLDVFVRGDRQRVSELNALLPPLRQIADTLAVLGFGQPRKVIIDQSTVVQGIAQGQREPSDATLVDVAGALLYVESTLAGMIGAVGENRREESHLPTTDLTRIHQLVIREARRVLQQAKQVLIDGLDGGWSRPTLEPLCDHLVQVRGALAMIPLPRAAGLLAACNEYIRQHLLDADTPPDSAQLDALADALSAIEYYLERMGEDHETSGDPILDIAHESLARLGCSPVPCAAIPEGPLFETALTDDERQAMQPRADQSIAQVLASPLAAVNPPGRDMPARLLPPPAGEQAVDDELRQVFLEEAEEVLAALQEYLPRWLVALATPGVVTNPALGEIRRAFHTLKGSGRMVRALVIGELAWSVENLLNRVLEGGVVPGQGVRQLLSDVQALLPELIADFARNAQRQRDDADRLAAQAQALASNNELAPVSPPEDDLDPVLLEIFRQEALGHLHTIDRFLDSASRNDSSAVGEELLRALHTLKGSAYMAGVVPIAELAKALDELVREFKANLIAIETPELKLLRAAEPMFYRGLEQLDRQPLAPIDGAAQLIEAVRSLLEQRLAAARLDSPDGSPVRHNPKLIETFLREGMDIVLDAENLLQRWHQHPGERQELTALLDELTTLGHGAHLAQLPQVDELCEALLDLYGAVEESSLAVSEQFFSDAAQAHEALIDMLDQIAAGQDVQPRPDCVAALHALLDKALDPGATGLVASDGSRVIELGAAIGQLDHEAELQEAWSAEQEHEPEDEIVAIFLEEAADILDSAGQALQRWLIEPDNALPLPSLQRDLHTLKGGARMANVTPVSDLSHELEAVYEGLIERRYSYSPPLAAVLLNSHDHLALMLEQLSHRQALADPGVLIADLQDLRHGAASVLAEPAAFAADAAERDPELLDIFLEEGFDILDSAGKALARWRSDLHNTLEVENLLRDLHTLKGSARMVELKAISDVAHELESLYESVSTGVRQPGPLLLNLLQRGHDLLVDMLDAVRAEQPLPDAARLIESIQQLDVLEPAVSVAAPAVVAEAEAERAGPEMVKVAAEDLEQLVNLAGETSIFRDRIEQQILDTQATLLEVETTLDRMRDQLRRLDTETQGSILSREQAHGERRGYEDFDPLEMDRHSQLQQLSRALSESASDLVDLKETLHQRNRYAETLLGKQARVNTQLQEGLMRTRMVTFERLVPRLRRVVRQVAGELNKQVRFDIGNADGELDRSVLERMVAPLEHMLRNAVDHGLESTERRIAAGKPEEGHIQLELMHEGGDIVIELSDDGPGVDLAAVRRKAIKRGLIHANAVLADHEVLPFILEAGFSTAEVITQISGRGVGMDVVHAEVKQLGGSMTIDSVPGQGTRFRIRLPLSVSINRVLMVQCGEEQYALPLNTIEGLVRVMPGELLEYYQDSPSRYRYGGSTYDLRYLGEMLGYGQPRLHDQMQPLPVLLINQQDQWVAVQVDALAGSREIVVKNLGPQFTRVAGITGATILGDGRVVLILDLLAWLRAQQGRTPAQVLGSAQQFVAEAGQRSLRVMVVDDSVTVRKVTGRLLERHGMQVVTAKDGLDAMAMLEQYIPDILLLDIEMPRMDGFEVASQIRHDERLKDLPIIMITSRSGQKHRDRAMAIGVNDYLSKPYQESVLLDSIARWSSSHA